jgi:WD40 repeat protein
MEKHAHAEGGPVRTLVPARKLTRSCFSSLPAPRAVTRAMSGHRSNVLCLELSQYGLLSGSMDTNVKVWDLRGRDVMSTFKGHHAAVRHVKFSPDGKWVASASDDGQVS